MMERGAAAIAAIRPYESKYEVVGAGRYEITIESGSAAGSGSIFE
jgi:hypothetical protein